MIAADAVFLPTLVPAPRLGGLAARARPAVRGGPRGPQRVPEGAGTVATATVPEPRARGAGERPERVRRMRRTREARPEHTRGSS